MFTVIFLMSVIPLPLLVYGALIGKWDLALCCAITFILILLLGLIEKKLSFFKPKTRVSLSALILLSLFAGRALNLYSLIPYWDKLLHFSSGLVFAQIGLEVYPKLKGNTKNKGLFLTFSLLCAFSAAGLWEVWEFLGDCIFNLNSQNASLSDTMLDMILGMLGGIIRIIPHIFKS